MRLKGVVQLSSYDLKCVEQAILYVQKHHKEAISIENLSMEAGIGIRKLRMGIKKITGLTLHEFHFQTRIEYSKPILLNTGYPLKFIASSVGFKNESHFCQAFKKRTAMTPFEFRISCLQ